MAKQLHNKVNRQELKAKILADAEPRTTVSFYQYAHIADTSAFRNELYLSLEKVGALGRIYIAAEGINAQASVPTKNIDAFRDAIYAVSFLEGVRLNWAVEDNGKSFYKLDVRVRPKIVADGIDDPNFDSSKIGKHLNAQEFNAMLDANPHINIVDMRNHYESEVGHFKNAILPDVDTFREQLPLVAEMLSEQKAAPVIMYCTGGIRCEKASAYMQYNGYEDVYQLEGGIIEYSRKCKELGLPNKFIGKNFVFDDRLGERISEDVIAHCHQCGKPADNHTNCANLACHLLFIQCEECAASLEGCCTVACQTVIHLPKEEQEALRQGIHKGRQVFKRRKGILERGDLM